jgi:hypothetical protein
MKDYTIWLKSGGSISGTMEDSEAARLKKFFKLVGEMDSFTDTDGELLLSSNSIIAVSLNAVNAKQRVGFK